MSEIGEYIMDENIWVKYHTVIFLRDNNDALKFRARQLWVFEPYAITYTLYETSPNIKSARYVLHKKRFNSSVVILFDNADKVAKYIGTHYKKQYVIECQIAMDTLKTEKLI